LTTAALLLLTLLVTQKWVCIDYCCVTIIDATSNAVVGVYYVTAALLLLTLLVTQ
jgi:hypothetical protein